MAVQQLEEEKNKDSNALSPNSAELTSSGSLQRPRRSRTSTSTATNLGTSPELLESGFHQSASSGNMDRIRRAVSVSSLNSLGNIAIIFKYHIMKHNYFLIIIYS